MAEQYLSDNNFFLSKMMNRRATSWELSTKGETSISIKGTLKEDTLPFSVSNSFSSGVGLSYIEKVDKLIGSAVDIGNKAYLNGLYATSGVIGDTLSDLVSMASKAATGESSNAASSIVGSVQDKVTEIGGATRSAIDSVLRSMNPDLDATKLGQAKYVSGSELIKTYGGTSISVPTITLDTYVMHTEGTNVLDYITDVAKAVAGDTFEEQGIIGIQTPPNGYKPELSTIGSVVTGESKEGTWTLRIGNILTLHNLIVTEASWEFKTLRSIEGWEGEGAGRKINLSQDPYMALLRINVDLIGMVTKKDLLELINRMKNNQDVSQG